MFQAASAAVLLAVEYQQIAQFVAMAASSLHRDQRATALGVVHGPFQAGGDIILLVDGKREGKDNSISFLAGHEFHPISRLMEKSGGNPSPVEEDRHPLVRNRRLIRVVIECSLTPDRGQ